MTQITRIHWSRAEEEDVADALRKAYNVATGSPDPSTQCGALIGYFVGGENSFRGFVGEAQACNTFPKGLEVTPERLVRPLKYSCIEHAERGAVYSAARYGVSCAGKIMVAPWAACTDCARSIVESGLSTLIRHKQASDRSPERWIESIALADEILIAGGVEIFDFDGHLGAAEIWHCEERWTP